MADNTQLPIPPTLGDIIATDDIGGAKYQRVKLIHGADGVNAGDVSTANGLPVTGTTADGSSPAANFLMVGGMTAGGVAQLFETNASGHLNISDGGGSITVDGVLTDAQLRAAPVAIAAAGADFWPAYTGADDTANQPLTLDPAGALITRGAVTTDEGTFRCNFANTSYAVGIGSVTVSGTTVTGTGFLNADIHYKDYFKISADAETAWIQIDRIVSDTEIQLVSAYVGSSSGTGQRSLVAPLIGTGGSLTVGSGQLTIASGTTSNSVTGIKRFTDYAPLVFRSRVSISQRIANQETHIGLEEDATITRWFARFVASGTTNTVIICETGRNPTGAPTASETETTTVTLPNGATTATLNDYRVELLTESVRFYINGVLVAEHVRVLPHQHDEMTSHVEVRNGTSPASTTSVVVDYLIGKNHNKLEIGIMSEVERIVASASPLQPFNYSVAGVIAINTDLIVLDCSQLRSLFIQCNSMGTTGTVTVQWSNTADFAQPITATLLTEAGATGTTITAAGLRVTNVMARYCRLRLTVATTAGTTTFSVWGAQTTYTPIVTTQPVSGTVTATVANATIASGTITSVTSSNLGIPSIVADVASAALTTTTTTAAFTPTFGTTYVVNIPVTAVTGTNPTLDVGVEESDDTGTNWYLVYSFPRITATGMYRSPPLTLRGNRVRYVQTITGTTPSFTRAINRLQRSDEAPLRGKYIDRTIVPNTISTFTPTYFVEGLVDFNLAIRCTAQTAAATVGIQFSDDGVNFITTDTTSTVVGTAILGTTNKNFKFARGFITVAGTGIALGELTITGSGR